jgi:hypothetical protein
MSLDHYNFTPPAVNLKCIVFTIGLALGYWFLPPHNKYVLVALCYFPYLALAWYDWIYSCRHNFGPTYLAHFYSWAKPQGSSQIKIYKSWAPEIKNKVLGVDFLIAIAILAFIPTFLKWEPEQMNEEEIKTAKTRALWALVLVVAIFVYLRFKKD